MPIEKRQSEWGRFLTIMLMVSAVAAWMLIPSKVLEATWRSELSQTSSWAGEGTQRWAWSKTQELIQQSGAVAMAAAASMGDSLFERWMKDRLYATWLWASIILYRSQMLLIWGLLGIPVILAAVMDGYYVREIRKWSFQAQSPIRHKLGVHMHRWVAFILVGWLLLPIPMPLVLAPLVMIFTAWALWLWTGNLQKRL